MRLSSSPAEDGLRLAVAALQFGAGDPIAAFTHIARAARPGARLRELLRAHETDQGVRFGSRAWWDADAQRITITLPGILDGGPSAS